MKVILKEDVEKLGRRGDVVNVAPGFGRNYLIPRKMALAVTPTNVKTIEIERAALKKKLEAERKSFQSLAEKLNQVTLTFTRRAGDKDVIFGSVSAADVKEALDGLGYDIDKKKILLFLGIQLTKMSPSRLAFHDQVARDTKGSGLAH